MEVKQKLVLAAIFAGAIGTGIAIRMFVDATIYLDIVKEYARWLFVPVLIALWRIDANKNPFSLVVISVSIISILLFMQLITHVDKPWQDVLSEFMTPMLIAVAGMAMFSRRYD